LEVARFVGLTRRHLGQVSFSCAAFSEMLDLTAASKACLGEAIRAIGGDPFSELPSTGRLLTRLEEAVARLAVLNGQTLQLLRQALPPVQDVSETDNVWETRLQAVPLRRLPVLARELHRLSHDLNNMLMAAQGAASMVVARRGDSISLLHTVLKALDRIELMLTEQLGALREEVPTPQRLADVPAAMEALKVQLKARLLVTVEVDPVLAEGPEELGLSQGQFHRLLFNLCDNAQKAGADWVNVTVLCQGNELVLVLQDDGPGFKGVDPLEASRQSKLASPENGNGIPICVDFCRQAGGSLSLVDPNAEGATWRIVLPLQAAGQR
jgi:signal transduction histidine kinase